MLDIPTLKRYLETRHGGEVEIEAVSQLSGEKRGAAALKQFGFFSLQRAGCLAPPFQALHEHFWAHYLRLNRDAELAGVIQPWFAWRALVLASPLWYPTISEDVRRRLLTFARRVMEAESYDFRNVNQYLEEA